MIAAAPAASSRFMNTIVSSTVSSNLIFAETNDCEEKRRSPPLPSPSLTRDREVAAEGANDITGRVRIAEECCPHPSLHTEFLESR